jgi:mannose-6-phosphate isomerase-like protein (cupin superfamily)
VVVPVTDGTLLLETLQGNREAILRLGQAYARPVGVEHNVINSGVDDLAFIEIELKQS